MSSASDRSFELPRMRVGVHAAVEVEATRKVGENSLRGGGRRAGELGQRHGCRSAVLAGRVPGEGSAAIALVVALVGLGQAAGPDALRTSEDE